jgi:hypothetical protein
VLWPSLHVLKYWGGGDRRFAHRKFITRRTFGAPASGAGTAWILINVSKSVLGARELDILGFHLDANMTRFFVFWLLVIFQWVWPKGAVSFMGMACGCQFRGIGAYAVYLGSLLLY